MHCEIILLEFFFVKNHRKNLGTNCLLSSLRIFPTDKPNISWQKYGTYKVMQHH
jgi:hypothetical protein